MNPVGSWRCVVLVARATLLEVSRQRLPALLLFGAVGGILGATLLEDFNFGLPPLQFLADLGQGVIALFGSVLAVTGSAQLFFGEIEQRTVFGVLAKPVGRAEFVLGKYLAVLALLAVFSVLTTAVLVVLLRCRGMTWGPDWIELPAAERLPDGLGLVLKGVARWLECGVLSACTLLLATFSSGSLGATLLGFGMMAIGHLQSLARATPVGPDPFLIRRVVGLTLQALPDLGVFNLTGTSADSTAALFVPLARAAACAVLYAGAAGALAVFSFRRREI
ncbi:MAG TPA: ABC transporter permease [Opitutaceae bacterium]|nr:ABC transporter permease [Opitutaceae bacterium]